MFYDIRMQGLEKNIYAWSIPSYGGIKSEICEVCGRKIQSSIYLDTPIRFGLTGGRIFTDFLELTFCMHEHFLLSERAVEIFLKEKISGIGVISPIAFEIDRKRWGNRPEPPMPYYDIEISGRVDFDLKEMRLKKKRYCPQCKQFEWNRQRLYPLYLDESTWDGGDICRISSMPGKPVCSEHFQEVVTKYQMSGVVFVSTGGF